MTEPLSELVMEPPGPLVPELVGKPAGELSSEPVNELFTDLVRELVSREPDSPPVNNQSRAGIKRQSTPPRAGEERNFFHSDDVSLGGGGCRPADLDSDHANERNV